MQGEMILRPETLAGEIDALAQAEALVIASNEDYVMADAFSVGLLVLEKAIKSDFKASKDAAFAVHRAICAQEMGHLAKVQEARAIIRPKLLAWETIKKKEAEEEMARREVIARKEAEDKALAEAIKSEKQGDKTTADAILAAPVQVAAIVVAPTLPKRQTRIPEAWSYRVINLDLVPREYLCADDKKLSGMARAVKGSVKVSGIEFFDRNQAE